jgi:hypothetical protein
VTPAALASTGKKPVSLELVMKEGLDQALGLPGEPCDHLNPQTFGQRQEAPVEAATEQHPHAGGSEMLEAPRPRLFGDGEF